MSGRSTPKTLYGKGTELLTLSDLELLFGAAVLGIIAFYSAYVVWSNLRTQRASAGENRESEVASLQPPMRIKDIQLPDVAAGKRWRVFGGPGNWAEDLERLEELGIESESRFELEDGVVYSGVLVTKDKRVNPLLMIKTVGDYDYGGDYCEYVDGSWRQLGLHPDPDAAPGTEFFARPLQIDPSFEAGDEDYRRFHHESFLEHAKRLEI